MISRLDLGFAGRDDPSNRPYRNCMQLGQRRRRLPLSVGRSYGALCFRRQLPGPQPVSSSALPGGVLQVVKLRSKEEMVRTNTRGVIALVEDTQPIWYWPMRHCPGESMGHDLSATDAYMAIFPDATAGPLPTAVIGAGNAAPKTRNVALGIVDLHREPPTRGVTPPDVCASRGFRVAQIIPDHSKWGQHD